MLLPTSAHKIPVVLGLGAALFASATIQPQVAHAQDEVDDEFGERLVNPPAQAQHGIGLRARYIMVPEALVEAFVEEAPSGVGQPGFGLDYVYRKAEFEFSVGFEYDKLSPDDGYFIESGGSTSELGSVDRIEFDGLAWYTIDASFVFHSPITDILSFRYGGGIGFGVVVGDIYSQDAACTGSDAQSDCGPIPGAAREKEDFFRYPPVFNALVGLQLAPIEKLKINVEVGMRTLFYTGIGAQYFF